MKHINWSSGAMLPLATATALLFAIASGTSYAGSCPADKVAPNGMGQP